MARRIFEDSAAQLRASRSRNVRPEQPYPTSAQFIPWPQQFGPTPLVDVSDMQVLGLPAAWRAVNFLANGVASMAPLEVYEDESLMERVTPTPNVCQRPDASMTDFEFWHMAIAIAVMSGNYVGLHADFDAFGYPRQMVSVPPQLCTCRYGEDGYKEMYVAGQRLSPLDYTHVTYFRLPGNPWGLGAVEVFRRGLRQALEQQHLAGDTYARGSVPAGIVNVPVTHPDPEQVDEAKAQWIDRFGGGQRVPAFLAKDWKYEAISWSPEDSQFLESRQFSVAEIALMFGLDPTDLGASITSSTQLTYANIEQREISRRTDAYGPLMLRFEQAWTDLLPGDQRAAFVPERLMRTDSKTKAQVHKINIESGVETQDEARAIERRKPAPKKPEPAPQQFGELAPQAPNGNGQREQAEASE